MKEETVEVNLKAFNDLWQFAIDTVRENWKLSDELEKLKQKLYECENRS